MRRQTWSIRAIFFGVVGLTAAGAVIFTWAGVYDVGADRPHSRLVSWGLAKIRQRAIEVRASQIAVPRLDDTSRIARGAVEYDAMCVECHLAPGVLESELRSGLNPMPPELSKVEILPAQAFWVIKHGIKMTGMPAWGKTHDDDAVWSIVAFLELLPTLNPETYRAVLTTARASEAHDMDHTHHHHGDESAENGSGAHHHED